MSLEEIQREWRTEMDRAIPTSELEKLLDMVQRRYAGIEHQVRGRDIREILVAVLVVGATAVMWPLCRSSPAAVLGFALIVLGAALIIYVLLSAKTTAPLPFQASVLEFSRNRLAWLDRQIRLLQTVVWWYVAPLSVGCLLLVWGLSGGAGLAFGVQALLVVAIGMGVVLLNQWTVRKYMQPVRDDLARLIEALDSRDPK
jgi:hypothetical protein